MADVNLSTTESCTVGLSDGTGALAKATSTTLVEYLIAGETIFPSGYDIAAVAGDGITMRERSLSDNWMGLLNNNFQISGLALPASSLSLTLTMGAGTACIAGRFLDIPATNLTFSPSITSYVYLKITRDVALNVTGAWYEVNTTGIQPTDSIGIGKVISAVGSITSTVQDLLPQKFAICKGPVAVASGSTRSHEGDATISVNQELDGVHFYTNFTLNAGVTLTPAVGSRRLIIVASESITIHGTIAANGRGAPTAPGGASAGSPGNNGTDQPGGNGGAGSTGGGSAGDVTIHGITLSTASTQLSSHDVPLLADPLTALGGASGGAGGGSGAASGGNGGAGGGSIVLIAPRVVLAATATLNTAGANGSNGLDPAGGSTGGGGGGGAGNVYILTRSFNDQGATFTQTGGSAGSGFDGGAAGGAGAAGLKQILLY